MEDKLEVVLDDMAVRFTPGGKMHIMEAISALAGTDCTNEMWEDLKQKKPRVKEHVEYVEMQGKRNVPVADSEGWEQIQDLLFDYLLDRAD